MRGALTVFFWILYGSLMVAALDLTIGPSIHSTAGMVLSAIVFFPIIYAAGLLAVRTVEKLWSEKRK